MRPEMEPWKPTDRASAEKLNKLLREQQRMDRFTVSPPLELFRGGGGVHLRLRRQAGTTSQTGFFAMVYDRVEFEINEESDSEPDLCNPTLLPRLRGEYSAIEVEPDPHDPGTFRVKDGGTWCKAGTCSALRDINRSNAEIEVEHMVVWVWEGTSLDCNESSGAQESSSDIEVDGHTGTGIEPSEIYYWMDLNTPREDCVQTRYFIVIAPDSDTPYV